MRLLLALSLTILFLAPAHAVLPAAVEQILKSELKDYKLRLDNVIIQADKKWILIKPDSELDLDEVSSELTLIKRTDDDDFLFSNGWIYTQIIDNTIKSFDYYSKDFQDILVQSKIHQEFILPKKFKLPRDLAFLAGRIPMELSSVELASDREILYKKKLEKIKSQTPFKFLAYSYNSGKLSEISIDKKSNEKLGEARDLEADKLGLKYLSSIHEFSGKTFFADLVTGNIFELKKERAKYDATTPDQKQSEPQIQASIEKIFTLLDLGVEDGIKDFAFNLNQSTLYIITKDSSNLLIIDFEKLSITKELELPKMIDGFQLISRSSQEPDKLVFFSKAKDIVFFLNTFDLRISDEIFLAKISPEYSYVPYSVLVTYDKILVGVEKISKLNPKNKSTGLMIFDSITNAFDKFIELDGTPQQMILSQNKNHIYVLSQTSSATNILKLDSKECLEEQRLTLDVDISQASSITEIPSAGLLAIPSSVSNNIVLVDTKELIALKKIQVSEAINILKVIN